MIELKITIRSDIDPSLDIIINQWQDDDDHRVVQIGQSDNEQALILSLGDLVLLERELGEYQKALDEGGFDEKRSFRVKSETEPECDIIVQPWQDDYDEETLQINHPEGAPVILNIGEVNGVRQTINRYVEWVKLANT